MTIDEAIQYVEDLGTEEENKIDYDKDSPHTIIRRKNTVKNYRQLAEWLRELKEAMQLLKLAVEDISKMQFGKECKVCSKKLLPNECPIHNNIACILEKDFKWRYADEALKLIGETNDEP